MDGVKRERTRMVMDFCVKASLPLLRLRDSAAAAGSSRAFAVDEAEGCAVARGSYLVADTIMRQTIQRAVGAKHGSSDFVVMKKRRGSSLLVRGGACSDALHHRPITEAQRQSPHDGKHICRHYFLLRFLGTIGLFSFMHSFLISTFVCYMLPIIRRLRTSTLRCTPSPRSSGSIPQESLHTPSAKPCLPRPPCLPGRTPSWAASWREPLVSPYWRRSRPRE